MRSFLQLDVLSQIAESHPPAAYSAYFNGFKGKFSYSLRTLSDFELHMQPIKEFIRLILFQQLQGDMYLDNERKLLALQIKFGR